MSGPLSDLAHNKPTEPSFAEALRSTIDSHSKEAGSNTPDFVLADFLRACLDAFDHAVRERDLWHGIKLKECPRYAIEEPNIPAVGVGTPTPPATEEPDSICKLPGHDFKILRSLYDKGDRTDTKYSMFYCARCGATKEIRFG